MTDANDEFRDFLTAIGGLEVEPKPVKEDRNAQPEADFQAVKASYVVKMENGEIWKSVKLPVEGSASKPLAQELLHAIEELYFFRRYDEGARFARKVLDTSADALDDEHRGVVALYEEKCLKKMRQAQSTP